MPGLRPVRRPTLSARRRRGGDAERAEMAGPLGLAAGEFRPHLEQVLAGDEADGLGRDVVGVEIALGACSTG